MNTKVSCKERGGGRGKEGEGRREREGGRGEEGEGRWRGEGGVRMEE